ncbi:MAG: hemerythrin family protein [Gallionella sp.]
MHWQKKLELGNDLIDTQHRILVLLCRKLDIAIKTGQSDQSIRWVMLELKKFAEFHFISEENLMHEIGYPDVDDHALIHTGLLQQFEMMMARISHHREFPEDLLHFLNKWLVQHIVQDDLKIAEQVRLSCKRPLGEDLYKQFLYSDKDL